MTGWLSSGAEPPQPLCEEKSVSSGESGGTRRDVQHVQYSVDLFTLQIGTFFRPASFVALRFIHTVPAEVQNDFFPAYCSQVVEAQAQTVLPDGTV